MVGRRIMKTIAALLSLIFSLTLFASTGETQSFRFDGLQRSNTLQLQGSKTRTEYRYEQRARTCYQQVIVGYQNVCRRVQTGTRCTTRNGQRVCTPVYTNRCTRRPIYRSQPYTCYEQVRVAYEVFDYYTNATVNFSFAPTPAGITANEEIKVTLNGEMLSTDVRSSGKLILLYNKQESSYMDNGTKFINTNYFVEFVDLEKARSALRGGITMIEANEDELVFEAGSIPNDVTYEYSLNLTQKKLLARDVTLYNSVLAQENIEIENQGSRSLIKVKLDNLGINLGKGSYAMTFRTGLSLPTNRILNSRDLPALKFDVARKLKVKKNGEVEIRSSIK